MSLVEELTRIIHEKKYNNITLSINGIPIITVNLLKDEKVIILVNNMNELRYYELHYSGDIDKFASEVNDILIYSGVDSMIRKMRGSSIKFYGDPYLEGEIRENKLIISQGEVDLDEEGEEVVRSDKHEITAVIGLTGVTVSKIIGAFALQYYV
jgi:hydroxyethylthiazole kinase-like sugar kinase family protein